MDFPTGPSHNSNPHPHTNTHPHIPMTNQDGRLDSHDDIDSFEHDNDESMLVDNDEKEPHSSSTPTTSTHKRTYQACEPCRMRKVRCDLGSVDAPTDPPCQRCRREKKTCYFTDTRRKRKAGDGPDAALTDEYIIRNRRTLPVMQDGIIEPAATSEGRPSLGPSHSQSGKHRVRGDGDVRNETAAEWFKEPINQPSDAFRLLVHAASKEQAESLRPSQQQSLESRVTSMQQAIDPSLNASEPPIDPAAERDLQIAIKAWNRVRFVRAGWFSAREGVEYIEYFYKELSPMTSVSLPILNGPAGHPKLLEEEPMLTVTLLTIASRYLVLKGAGRTSRSMYIHQTMWNYLQDMITRMYWGQEQNVVASQKISKNDDVRQGLRTLGTVESLLLLSDWHPRSLHFPPNTDTGSIIAPAAEEAEEEEKPSDFPGKGLYSEWSEPLLRSDLMSWSLVSSAYTLAVELGVMDSLTTHGHWVPYEGGRASNDHERADRAGRLVHIYVSQTCGRLGYPNLLPNLGENMRIDYMRMPDDASGVDMSRQEILIDTAQRAWAELAAIMRDVNARLFPSKSETSQIIQSGRYKALVDSFSARLKEWRKRFERFQMPKVPGTTLLMEFEYSRTYVHSLSLQAVMEQSAMFANENAGSAAETDSSATAVGNVPSVSAKLVEIAKQNEAHINELIDASRNLLTHVIKDLFPSGALKHAPVRTNFRILSAAMFLLKTFAIGGKEAEMYKSLDLIANTAEVLGRTSIDDLQLAATVSDLLTRLTISIGKKFRKTASPHQRQSQKKHRGSMSRGMPTGPNKAVRRRESANARAIPRSDILKSGPVDSLAGRPRLGDAGPSPLARSQSDSGPAPSSNVPPGYTAHPLGNPPIGFANYPNASPSQIPLNYNAYTPDGMSRNEYMQSSPPILNQQGAGVRFSPSTGATQPAVYSPHSTASNPALQSPGLPLDSNGQAPYDWWQLNMPQGGNSTGNVFGPGLEEGLMFFEGIANFDEFTGGGGNMLDEDILGLQSQSQGQVNGRGAGQGSGLYY